MTMRSVSELEDDLAVNRAILASLHGETFEGAEGERREAKDEIANLEEQLKEARQQSGQARPFGSSAGESSHTTANRQSSQQPSPANANSHSTTNATNPSTPRRSRQSKPMEGRQGSHDIWDPTGSGSLVSRSRKRDFSATHLPVNDGKPKSLRTTPIPASPRFSSPHSTHESEIIDLTGLDDGDDTMNYLNRLKKEEERRAQEKRDRDMAFGLSSDGSIPFGEASASAGFSSRQPGRSSGSDAFSHLMATQRANAFAPSQGSGSSHVKPEPTPAPRTPFRGPDDRVRAQQSVGQHDLARESLPSSFDTLDMPGSYQPSWDNPQYSSTNPQGRPGQDSNRSRSQPSSTSKSRHGATQSPNPPMSHDRLDLYRHPYDALNWLVGVPMNEANRAGLQSMRNGTPASNSPSRSGLDDHDDDQGGLGRYIREAHELINPNHSRQTTPKPARRRSDMPNFGDFRRARADMNMQGGGLHNIIERTGMYDYVNGLDAFGRPLNDRITSLFRDSDPYADPETTAKELDDLMNNVQEVEVPPGLQGITPDALATPLYKHQEIALTWMKKMESGTNKGGILADDMGLGKTISTLALMHERKSTSRPKTNLIIGPLALIRQWEEEILKKTKPSHRLSTFVYHQRKSTTEELLRYDVVLTTYGTLGAELKRLVKWHDDNKGRIDYNDRALEIKCPLLHPTKAKFHRIILDEAQCIKNKDTQTAKACHKLRAEYRWCLTGTPMMNGVLELYSLVKFLQIKPYHDWERFRLAFGILFGKKGDSKHAAMQRLRALLKAILLRRKKDSMLDGKPIVILPPKTEAPAHVKLSQDERDFYTQLESKSQVIFNKYLREGSIGKNYQHILVLLLRLRQACCHPHLNLDVEDVTPVVDDTMLDRVKRLDALTVERIKERSAFECPVCYDAITSPTFFFPCGHDCCQPCLTQLIDTAAQTNLRNGTESSKVRCVSCRTDFEPKECFTYEAFQQVFMPEVIAAKKAADAAVKAEESASDSEDYSDSASDSGSDVSAADDVDQRGNLRGFVVNDSDESECSDLDEDVKDPKLTKTKLGKHKSKSGVKDEEVSDVKKEKDTKRGIKDEDEDDEDFKPLESFLRPKVAQPKKNKKKKRREHKGDKAKAADVKPSMLKELRKASVKNRAAYKKYMAYLRHTFLPSAKVDECIRLLKEFEATGEKAIVFSQWTLLLDLLEVAMGREFDNKPERYDGAMSATERVIAARNFRDKRSVTVMLVSLRAGNAGLNLTSASRVIIMDPFWNPYIEMQAVDRAYRIGQKNEVKVYRILSQETVEDRIIELQERKKEMVEAALDESESMKIGRLSTMELKFLFHGRN